MNRREFIFSSSAGAMGLALGAGGGSAATRPNILHIQCDQMQWAAIANRSGARTPNLNRLAAQGLNFERSYTASAVCCPSRAMLCTGAYHWHNGVFNQVHSSPSVHRDMFPGAVTYSQRLRAAGYYLGLAGKWHASFIRSPLSFGYHEIAAPLAYNPELLKAVNTNPDDVPDRLPNSLRAFDDRKVSWPGSRTPFTAWGHYEGPIEQTECYWVAEHAIRMMRRYAQGERPWYLEVQFLAPHDPYMPHSEYLRRYNPADVPVPRSFHDTFAGKPEMHRRESESWGPMTEDDYRNGRAHYYAYCEEVDAQIGRILDALKQSGQEDNTLVAFTADHGDMVGNHRMWIKGWIPYEECYRVPLILRWPARIKPGQTTRHLAQVHDLAHTYVAAAQADPLPYPEGRSLLPLGDGSKLDRWPDHILCAYYGGEFLYTQRMVITDRHKYVFNGFAYDELYDLHEDPEEMHNRIDDPGYASVADDMRSRLYTLMEQLGDPFGDPSPRFNMPNSELPNRYGAPRYLSRGKRITA